MDKRLLLFVVIAAIVFLITPKLFPPPARPPSDTQTPVDSAKTFALNPDSSRHSDTSRTAARTTPASGRQSDSLPVDNTTGTGDTVVVTTPKVTFQFSTLGAMPIGASLHDYKMLPHREADVQLARVGVPLVTYAVLNGSGDTLRLDRTVFTVDSSALHRTSEPALSFHAVRRGTTVAISYTFAPDSYLVHVQGAVASSAAGGHYLVATLPTGLRSNEADTLDDQRNLAYAIKPVHDDAQSISFGKLTAGQAHVESGPLTWVASRNKYFLFALLTDSSRTPFSEVVLRGGANQAKAAPTATATALQPIRTDGQFAFTIYAGPQEWRRLLALGRDLQDVNPHGGFARGIIQPFSTIVMRILLWMHDSFRINYGWVVIIFGIAVRLILWPLNQSAMRSSLRMQRLQPELQAIQRQFRSNPEKQHAEMMRLYREHGMSPLSPMAGCLPMLIPMPVLYALFFVFENTIEFRGVSFLWMADISLKDPYYILPVVMGLSMFLVSWIGLRSSPPNNQAKMMAYIFPAVMTLLFYKFAAGLNLYYAVQNIASLPQQWLIARERAKVTSTSASPATQRG